MAITTDDILELENFYNKARADSKEIKWINNYPEYPESITAFFRYITSSSWCYPNYKPGDTKNILKRIRNATLIDIQSVLTSASRGERFCSGQWIDILKEDKLAIVIKRAKELIKT